MESNAKFDKIASLKKPERRLSPLNPFSGFVKGDSDSDQFDDRNQLRKRSFGLSLRKLATETSEMERATSRMNRNNADPERKPPRSLSRIRSRELSENLKMYSRVK